VKNQPGPVGPQHQQVASTSSEVQDFDPEPFENDEVPFDHDQVMNDGRAMIESWRR